MKDKGIFLIIAALALVLAVVGSVILFVSNKKAEGYVETEARVIGYVEKSEYDDDGHYYVYAEKVEYTVDGIQYFAVSDVYTTRPKSIGAKMKISYDPQQPSKYAFVENKYFIPVILYIISGVLVLCGIGIFVYRCVINN
ncbi:MAG: DUF3592 domain-containing protein [Clostridia bacterium]|nr:DUF3592 domain-containing protein [Clostridia bacterium]